MKRSVDRGLWLSWAAMAAWMAVIFAFSAQTGERSGGLSGGFTQWVLAALVPRWEQFSPDRQEVWLATAHLLLRKACHVSEYAVLGGLLMNAWSRQWQRVNARAAAFSALCGLLYAAGDELHQAFVPGRGPAVTDVLIDFGGVLLGVGLIWLLKRKHKRRT